MTKKELDKRQRKYDSLVDRYRKLEKEVYKAAALLFEAHEKYNPHNILELLDD